MKRSSRLIILIGILLAVVAVVLIFITLGGGGLGSATATPSAAPTETTVLEANTDIALGTVLTPDMVTPTKVPIPSAPADALTNPAQVTGRIARADIRTGDIITSADFASGYTAQGDQVVKALKAGFRAMAVQVDQVNGVGTLIQPGDHVDAVIGLKIQQYVPGTGTNALPQAVPGGPQLSVKDIIQNLEVVGALLPPPAATTTGQQQPAASAAPSAGVGLTGQQEIVLLAVTAQQSEVIKYAEASADTPITLILRSPADATAPPEKTSGVTLNVLVQQYGVLPPEILMGTLPR